MVGGAGFGIPLWICIPIIGIILAVGAMYAAVPLAIANEVRKTVEAVYLRAGFEDRFWLYFALFWCAYAYYLYRRGRG